MTNQSDIPSDFLASGSLTSAVRRLRGDLIGQQVGVYQIISLLGVGGMLTSASVTSPAQRHVHLRR